MDSPLKGNDIIKANEEFTVVKQKQEGQQIWVQLLSGGWIPLLHPKTHTPIADPKNADWLAAYVYSDDGRSFFEGSPGYVAGDPPKKQTMIV